MKKESCTYNLNVLTKSLTRLLIRTIRKNNNKKRKEEK